MGLRLRLPELLEKRGMTPYQLAKASRGRISLSGAYRLVQGQGRLSLFSATLLEGLCDVLDVEPNELFEKT